MNMVRDIVRQVMGSRRRAARFTSRDLLWLDGDDLDICKKVMADFHKATLANAGKEVQQALLLLIKKKVGKRQDGGARALAQFSAFILMGGESYWPSTLTKKEQFALSALAALARSQGASLLRGHDTVANAEDRALAMEVIKELGHWASTKWAVAALRKFIKAVGKHEAEFLKLLQEKNPDRKWDRRMANKYLVAATVTNLGDRPVSFDDAHAANMLLTKVLLA